MFLRLLVIPSLGLSATGLGILALQLLQPPGQPRQVARVEAEPRPRARPQGPDAGNRPAAVDRHAAEG
jgi:hypothetical protein